FLLLFLRLRLGQEPHEVHSRRLEARVDHRALLGTLGAALQVEVLLLQAETRLDDAGACRLGGEVEALDERALAGEPRKVERLDAQPALGNRAPRLLAVERERELALRAARSRRGRSEEHTSELQSRQYLVCRLLLEK